MRRHTSSHRQKPVDNKPVYRAGTQGNMNTQSKYVFQFHDSLIVSVPLIHLQIKYHRIDRIETTQT